MAELNLRKKVVEGGAFLVIRRGVGIVISLVGMLVLTKLIGAKFYGLYSTISVITVYLIDLCAVGIRDYLIREEGELKAESFHSAFSFILVTTLSAVLIGIALSYPLSIWLNSPEIRLPFISMLVCAPFYAFIIPCTAKMERELNFRFIAWIEFHTQTIFYVLALGMAFMHAGVWAPVLANVIKVVISCFICSKFAKYKPRFYWRKQALGAMLHYGVRNVSARTVGQLRSLVNPLVVGRLVGPEAVACVALTIRLIEALSFVNTAIQHVSFPVLSKIQRDRRLLGKALDEAVFLQMLGMAPFLIGFALLSPWLFPLYFQDDWLPILNLFPFLAVGAIVNSIFSLHAVVLYVNGSNRVMFRFGLANTLLLGISAWFLSQWLGIFGYAVAEIVTIASFGIIHLGIRQICEVHYKQAILVLAACVPPFFLTSAAYPWALLLLVPLPIVLWLPPIRRRIRMNVQQIIRRSEVAS
ncbi:oligosaccharide flippase family protein [Paenibacillus glycanilyticus]|uniref:oligosaccharide flippase family protein n=1 Tax=Paenibacillus glycanilyticus TaxID=126569 RepID=UPI003EBCDA72